MAAQSAVTEAFTNIVATTFSGIGRPGAQPGEMTDRRRKELAAARAALLGGRTHAQSALRIAVTRAVRDAHDTGDAFNGAGDLRTARGADDAGANAVDTNEVLTWATRAR